MSKNKTQVALKALIIYWSATGNTEKVAFAIKQALSRGGITPVVKRVAEAAEEELYDYNLVFFGAPSYSFQPPEPVQRFIKAKMDFRFNRKTGHW